MKARVLVAGIASMAVLAMGSVTYTALADTGENGSGTAADAERRAQGRTDQNVDRANQGAEVELNLDLGDGYDRGRLRQLIDEVSNHGGRLSDYLRQRLETVPQRMPGPGADRNADFDGKVTETPSGISIVIDVDGDARTDASGWQTLGAATLALAITLGGEAACLTWLPALAPFCAGISAALGELAKSVVIMYCDGKIGEAEEWGNTVINVAFAAIGGIAWSKTGIGKWMVDEFPGKVAGFGTKVKTLVQSMGWFGSFFQGAGNGAGDFMIELGPFLRRAAEQMSRRAQATDNPTPNDPPAINPPANNPPANNPPQKDPGNTGSERPGRSDKILK